MLVLNAFFSWNLLLKSQFRVRKIIFFNWRFLIQLYIKYNESYRTWCLIALNLLWILYCCQTVAILGCKTPERLINRAFIEVAELFPLCNKDVIINFFVCKFYLLLFLIIWCIHIIHRCRYTVIILLSILITAIIFHNLFVNVLYQKTWKRN